jgi:glutamate carboxypeptidase
VQPSIDAAIELLRELVEIESPSGDALGVTAVAERLGRELEAVGLTLDPIPVPGAGPILRARSHAPGRPVMLLGHLDTVWPRGTLARRPVTIEGDVLRGPGAFDMKGGLVVAVSALSALAARGPLPPVQVFFTPLEEVGSDAYREVMETEMKAAAAVLDFEPAWPGGAVKTSRKGAGTFTLTAVGRAAHAGADFGKGRNAVLELARRCLEASALTDPDRGVTVNVGTFHGGLRPNVVPDRAEAEVDVRYATLADGHQVEQALRRLRAEDEGVSLRVGGGLSYPPLERGPHVVAVFERARRLAAEIGFELEEVATGGASEASFAAALGVPTLDGLGPDGDGAHAEHEHVRLSSLAPRTALAAALVADRAGSD